MQISSIVDIVNGKLINSPAISFVTQIHTKNSKINEGDLFIAKNKCDIELAVKNGAFALLFDFDADIIDDEIAWIRVEDITISQIKLLRFILGNKTLKSFYCDKISFELLNIYSYLNKNIILLSDNINLDFEFLKNITDDNILISNNQIYIQNIHPLSLEFIVDQKNIKNLTQHSLFTTTFSYKSKLFYKLRLPSMYIDYFLSIYNFLDLELDTNKLNNFKYFSPIFINKYFEIVDFGKSNKFILFNNNNSLIENEIKYLKSNYSYAKIKIIDKFKDDNDLLRQIKKDNFNALYIKGKVKKDIETLLMRLERKKVTLI